MRLGQPDEGLLAEQRAYYEARAPEYDDWFFRRGRYDRGRRASERWFDEVAEVRTELAGLDWENGRTLELAPGTGIWTEWLCSLGARVTAVDASPAMLAEMARRLGPLADSVEVEEADLFEWRPTSRFHGVFFSFFVSHVPRERLAGFFETVAAALEDGGHVAFVDSRREETSTAVDHVLPEEGDEVMTRRLADGTEYRIVKNFYEPAELEEAAHAAGIELRARLTEHYFCYGWGRSAR